MKKRIIISVVSDLATDQRILKVSRSCHENGYDILLIGRKLKNSLPIDLPFKVKRMRLFFNHSALFYAEYNLRLFFKLLFLRADVFLSNDTDTLLANYLASVIRRKKLVFDAHELFPEVPELANRPKIKKVWVKLEDWLFPKLKYSYTVCQSISSYYNERYNLNMQVVRNIPYYSKIKDFASEQLSFPGKKIILYQGALNVGRGLEWVIEAMPLINDAILIIIGDGDIKAALEKMVVSMNLNDRVVFLGRIPADRLHNYTSHADIGLCLLEDKGLSYYYSLPNRIFDYMQSNVPVLATDFPEISNIVKLYNTGSVISHYEPEYLAGKINEMLKNPMSTDHFDNIAKIFCWENEEKVLLEIINSTVQ